MNPNEQPNAQPQAPAEPAFVPGIANAPAPAPAQPEQPQQPAEQPAQQPEQPQQPAEQPAEQPAQQPNQPAEQPAENPAPTTNNGNFDYDAYLDELIGKSGDTPIEMPKVPTQEELSSDDQALTKYFGDLVDTAVKKALQENNQQTTIRQTEQRAWESVFEKYPEIKESKGLRDTIHNIRVGAFQRGQALTPLQVAEQLIGDLHTQYKKGVNDTNVQTTVRDSQPLGGGTTPPPTGASVDYSKLQDGGQNAAVSELEKLIQQGKI